MQKLFKKLISAADQSAVQPVGWYAGGQGDTISGFRPPKSGRLRKPLIPIGRGCNIIYTVRNRVCKKMCGPSLFLDELFESPDDFNLHLLSNATTPDLGAYEAQ